MFILLESREWCEEFNQSSSEELVSLDMESCVLSDDDNDPMLPMLTSYKENNTKCNMKILMRVDLDYFLVTW